MFEWLGNIIVYILYIDFIYLFITDTDTLFG